MPPFLLLLCTTCTTKVPRTPRTQADVKTVPRLAMSSDIGEKCSVINTVAHELCKIANIGKHELTASKTIATKYPLQSIAEDRVELHKMFPEQSALVDRLVELSKTQEQHSCASSPQLVEFVRSEQLREVLQDSDKSWRGFESRWPNSCGLGRFSGVAFSGDGRWVLLYGEIQYGNLAASGSYWLMRKDQTSWVVAARREMWMM